MEDIQQKVLQEIQEAKENGYTAIDISQYSDQDYDPGQEPLYDEYGYIIINDVTVYDKYGDGIDRYQLGTLEGVTDAFSLDDIYTIYRNPTLTVHVDKKTRMYPLSRVVSRNVEDLIIICTNNYIPPYVFESITAYKLNLQHPILDDDVLRSIHSYDVSIILEDSYPSFKPLKDCRIFKLWASIDQINIPPMPENAYDVTLLDHISFGALNDRPQEIILSNNSTIKKLTVEFALGSSDVIHLENLSSLRSLTMNAKSHNGRASSRDGKTLSIDLSIVDQLEELICLDMKSTFVERNGNFCIASNNENNYNLFTLPLPNIKTFAGTFEDDDQYLLLSGLKKLTVGDKILNYKYIPESLEEYYFDATRMTQEEFATMKELEEHLFSMNSMKRMPLVLTIHEKVTFPFDERYDILYDIYLEKTGKVISYLNDMERIKSYFAIGLTSDMMLREHYPGKLEFIRAIAHNKRYTNKDKQLHLLA